MTNDGLLRSVLSEIWINKNEKWTVTSCKEHRGAQTLRRPTASFATSDWSSSSKLKKEENMASWCRVERKLNWLRILTAILNLLMFPADAKRGGQPYVQEITGAKWGTSHGPGYVSVAAKSKEQQPPSFVYSRRLPQAVTPAFILVFFFFFVFLHNLCYRSYFTVSNEIHKDKKLLISEVAKDHKTFPFELLHVLWIRTGSYFSFPQHAGVEDWGSVLAGLGWARRHEPC